MNVWEGKPFHEACSSVAHWVLAIPPKSDWSDRDQSLHDFAMTIWEHPEGSTRTVLQSVRQMVVNEWKPKEEKVDWNAFNL